MDRLLAFLWVSEDLGLRFVLRFQRYRFRLLGLIGCSLLGIIEKGLVVVGLNRLSGIHYSLY